MNGANNQVLVIDHGSVNVRAGMPNFLGPQIRFPSIIGTFKSQFQDVLPGFGNRRIGDKINAGNRNMLNIRYPINRGIVTNWDDLQLIWNYLFAEMQIDPENHPILLSESPLTSKPDRERMTKIMFEDHDIPAFYIANQSVLSVLATGTSTGLVLDIGGGITHSVPVYEGYALPHATNALNIGGIDLTNHMVSLLAIRGHDLNTPSGRVIANDIKETLCFVAHNINQQMIDAAPNVVYERPGGNDITLGSERFLCPEVVFSPHMLGIDAAGIHHMVQSSINKCDPEIQNLVKDNIILSGGSSLIAGLRERVQFELNTLYPNEINVRDLVTPDIMSWIGGSNLASFELFQDMCITLAEYNECGAGIVHTKCF